MEVKVKKELERRKRKRGGEERAKTVQECARLE